MKPRNRNAKDPKHIPPIDLPHVKPEDYPASKRDSKDGTVGFSSQYAGHAKDGHSHTSSFDAGPPDYTLPGYPSGKDTAKPK